jgi:hypothetical protein
LVRGLGLQSIGTKTKIVDKTRTEDLIIEVCYVHVMTENRDPFTGSFLEIEYIPEVGTKTETKVAMDRIKWFAETLLEVPHADLEPTPYMKLGKYNGISL